jgi:hypothetical protein
MWARQPAVRFLTTRRSYHERRPASRLQHPLEVVDLTIGAPGAAEVLVDVRACGLCHTDQAVWTGDIPWPVPAVGILRHLRTLVLEPSPHTPLATLRMDQVRAEALPPGVLNIVSGPDPLG